ncbi:response regulator transcription factor [Nocardia sp. 2]|uniref:Response regulator transcription factor n=1 Tax=Nocardia acididurans TaxID=2802282 RepID=A0ABS1MB48_9NOCA|nr:response regulator transcription factor [Nocardia acididurans]MBL1077496.1 response regulator transcription factor [Nocardia acididurans]
MARTESDLAELLTHSRNLLDIALSDMIGSQRTADAVTPLWPDERWGTDLEHMLANARHEAILAISGPVRHEPEYGAGKVLLHELHDAGTKVRLLLSPDYVRSREQRATPTRFAVNSQIRVTDTDFCNTVIIDRRVAALWAHTADRQPRGVLVTEPTLLGVIHQFATKTWSTARRLRDHLDADDAALGENALAVIRYLNEGLIDEVAARRLAVSVRTYRRYVADIMDRLGVTTRFQLGARARELGLLS